MLFPVRGGPSSSPGEPQAAACSTSRGASRVMTKCNRIKIQKSNILLQPGTTGMKLEVQYMDYDKSSRLYNEIVKRIDVKCMD